MLEDAHGGDEQCLGRGLCQRGWAERLIGWGNIYQDGTSASDGPTDSVRCPIDTVFIEERGLFDGSGVFCWTLWSGHWTRGMEVVRLS